MELRKTRRYRLSAPAFYCWERADGTLQEAQGTTCDISSRGVFVLTDALPPAGAHLELNVHLPSLSGTPSTVQLTGEGTVLRVARAGAGQSGFAADVTFHTESSDSPTVLGDIQ
jgi:hypothetical protein